MAGTTQKIILKVGGMYCSNCEKRIQNALRKVPGVLEARVRLSGQTAEVLCEEDSNVSEKDLRDVIEGLGYEVLQDKSRAIRIVSILIMILAVYVIADRLGWLRIFNVFPTIETSLSLGVLFTTGLLTGVHCIAMCGGINLTQSVLSAEKQDRQLSANLLYNTGRVVSYTTIGAAAGGIGSVISPTGSLRGIVAVIAGCAMFLMALRMLGLSPFRFLKPLNRKPFNAGAGIRVGAWKMTRTLPPWASSLIIGLLNGLMPCGPLQAMQLYALSAGSAAMGALSMLVFSLGTVPLMMGFGFVSGKLNRKYRGTMLTVSAVLIFIMGIHMLGSGLSLSGVQIPFVGSRERQQTAMIDGEVQKITTQIDYGSYEPMTVHRGIPVEWVIHVPEGRLNGCNGEILIPELDLDIKLQEGDNAVTFTPEETGTISYSCWMGMIKSSIRVVD